MLKPQLPATTVVTPWRGDGLSVGSQNAWASRWVCTSMKPGADDPAVGVDRVRGAVVVDVADGDDAAASDADVGADAPERPCRRRPVRCG